MSLASRTNMSILWADRKPQRWQLHRSRWFAVAPKRLWIGTIIACVITWLSADCLSASAIRSVQLALTRKKFNIAALGFGAVSPYERADLLKRSRIGFTLFANFWQVLVSILYVQYNALLTAFLVGEEWSRFACATPARPIVETEVEDPKLPSTKQRHIPLYRRYAYNLQLNKLRRQAGLFLFRRRVHRNLLAFEKRKAQLEQPEQPHVQGNDKGAVTRVRKTLRVSNPEGIQRSSYFISMPWKYGVPLMSAMFTLHWLVSQSIFVYMIDLYGPDGNLDSQRGLVRFGLGFSIEPMVCSVVLGACFIIALIILGLRRYPTDMPLASTCSAAISAACHPPPGDEDAYLFPLQWGVVSTQDGVGHCSLTTARDVQAPQIGAQYS